MRKKKPDFKITYEENKDYSFFRITGTDSLEVSLAYWEEVFRLIKKHNCKRVMVEEELEGNPSITDAYKIVTAVTEMTRKVRAKIVFYDLKEEHRNLNEFGESVGLTRGSPIKVVKNHEEALQYLLER